MLQKWTLSLTLTLLQPVVYAQERVDVSWWCQQLINNTDLWNGGKDGVSGMGSYGERFSGFFAVNLSREWQPQGTQTSTSVAQERAIYMNIEAYRATGAERFKKAALKGTAFLMKHFWDPTYGGFYWMTDSRGNPTDRTKQGYGNVFGLFTLAQLYEITRNPADFEAMQKQLQVIEKHFLDPELPGVVRPGLNFDFSEVEGYNNIDTFTHYFEALLAVHDVTQGEQQAHVDDLIRQAGEALSKHLYRPEKGFTDRGYVAYNYTRDWTPSLEPYSRGTQWTTARQASTGHNIELAYLLSRAVERGFDPSWMNTSDQLRKFVEVHAMDPRTGGMLYEVTDDDGSPLPGNPDNSQYVWWANSEAARAFLNLWVVQDRLTLDLFSKQQDFIKQHFVDSLHGGWFQNVDADTLQVFNTQKGNIWTVNYHETMLATEVLRLAKLHPEKLQVSQRSCVDVR